MTPFAQVFMFVSMGAVSLLTLYCLSRILKAPPPSQED
jgi:hypothetical protein